MDNERGESAWLVRKSTAVIAPRKKKQNVCQKNDLLAALSAECEERGISVEEGDDVDTLHAKIKSV